MELQPFMIWFLTYNENLYILVSDIILCAVYYQLSCTTYPYCGLIAFAYDTTIPCKCQFVACISNCS